MKRMILLCIAGLFFINGDLSAADGDLIIDGNAGIGTTSPTAQLHVKGNFSKALTGTVSVTQSLYPVIGTGTLFMTELQVNDPIMIASQIYTVSAVISNTEIDIDYLGYRGQTASGLTAYVDPNLLSIDNGNGVNLVNVTKSGNLKMKNIQLGSGLPGWPRANRGLCWTSTGTIGYCRSALDSSGTCSCYTIN